MSAFREMLVEWEGERYTFSPSNKFLRRIDREVSLASLATRAEKGEAPIFDMAFVIAEILSEAGVETNEDQVIGIITDEDEGARAQYLVGLINDLMPKGKSSGGVAAPKKTPAKRKK